MKTGRSWKRMRAGRFGFVLTAVGAALVVSTPLSATVPGEVDQGVGPAGSIVTNFGGTYDWAYATAVQPDGKVIVAGVSNAAGTHDFAVARYNPDLSLDETFGNGGTVLTDFGDSWDWAYTVALQPDDKIVVGGVSDRSDSRDFALARYGSDGALDESFGDGGVATMPLRPLSADIMHGVVIEPDGAIVASGVTFDDAVTVGPNGDFMLARFNPQGRLDPSFGVGGVTVTDFGRGTYDEPYAMVRQDDGRIILGGYTFGAAGSGGGDDSAVPYGADQLAMARYRPDGLLDDTFGQGGTVVLDAGTLDEEIHGLALTPNGKIVAAGFVNGEKQGDLMLSRFTRDGALDPGFGHEGMAVANVLGSRSERLAGVTIQPDGKIVAAGQIATGPTSDFGVVRYTDAGALDESFAENGIKAVDIRTREDRARAVTLQPDGKILGVGTSETDFGLVRLHG